MVPPGNREDVAVLRVPGIDADIELPVLFDSFGGAFVDIQKLYSQHKVCTFDPGFMSTASCVSSITYIDGDEGILLYRGYKIEELVDASDFYDVAF
jgi:citrate synthase